MKLESKLFDELSTRELYEILRARTAVFVVEQKCPYQDVDGIDCRSLHVFYAREDGRVEAYLRAFWKEDAPGPASRAMWSRWAACSPSGGARGWAGGSCATGSSR